MSIFLCFIAIWALINLNANWSSFDKHEGVVSGEAGLLPLLAFFSLALFNAFGMMPIPWIMLSEMYPTKYVVLYIILPIQPYHLFHFRTRGLASGITASVNYIMIYVSISTFYYFESWFTFAGVLFGYSAIGFVG